MEINSGVHLLKSYICEVPLFTSGGLGLGLKNLVLFTSLAIRPGPWGETASGRKILEFILDSIRKLT